MFARAGGRQVLTTRYHCIQPRSEIQASAYKAINAQEHNCVSAEVAQQMAAHVCDKFSAHWGIGITGYAMAVPESGNELFAYYAIAHKCKVLHEGEIRPKKDEPLGIQLLYVRHVMDAFVTQLHKM